MNMIIRKRTLEKIYVVAALVAYSAGIYTLFFPIDPTGDGAYQQNFVSQLINFPAYLYAIYVLTFYPSSVFRILRITWLLWLLVVLCFASALWSIEPMDTARRAILLLLSCAFGAAIAARFSVSEFLLLLGWAFLIVAVMQIIALLTMPGLAIHQDHHYPSMRGFFAHKNPAGRFMAIGFLVGLCLHSYRKHRMLARAVMILCAMIAIATLSRTAMALIIFLAVLYFAAGFIFKQRLAGMYLLIVCVSFATLMVGSGVVVEMLNDFVEYSGRDMTLTGRTLIWEDVAGQMTGTRFWIGYGYESFWRSEKGGLGMRWWGEYIPPHAHNGFVQVWVALGVVGLFFLIVLIGSSLLQTYINLLAKDSPHNRACFVLLHGHLLYNITEQSMLTYGSFLWLLFVMMSTYTSIERLAVRSGRSSGTMVSGKNDIRA